MKQHLLKSIICIVLATGFESSYAQNSLELKWGYLVPVNNQLNKAFTGSQAFSIALLHPLKSARFEVGLQYSRLYLKSNNLLSANNYGSNFYIQNYSVKGKYYFIRHEALNVSANADLGISRLDLRETKDEQNYIKEKTGLTTAISSDVELKFSQRVFLCVGAQSMFCFTDNLKPENNNTINKIVSVGGNIGVKILLRKDNDK